MALVGLQLDLEPWRQGVRGAGALVRRGINGALLRPFDAAMKKSAMGLKGVFGGVSKFIKGALSSAFAPLIALFTVAKVLGAIKDVIVGSYEAFNDYSDSVVMLQSALRTLGKGVDVSAATEEVKGLGEQLRLAMGLTGTEVNKAFGTLVTRGFDMRQARQLTILAASYAKKSGKPIEEVTKKIADAANGSVDAMKDLGVQITATGDRVRDGEAAVLALKGAYGDIGSELADPSERLAAAWNMMAVSLGEKISPVIDPIVQGISDFVVGLTKTEEGQAMIQKVADAIRFVVEFIKQAIISVSNLVEMTKAGGGVIVGLLKAYINEVMRFWVDALRSLPGGDWLLEKMGLDGEGMSAAFREQSQAAMDEVRAASSDFMRAQGEWLRGESDTGIAGQFGALMEAGKREREAAAKALQDEIRGTAGETFAGRPAQEAQEAADAKRRDAAIKSMNSKVTGRAGVEEGQKVGLRIISARSDRWRKARFV